MSTNERCPKCGTEHGCANHFRCGSYWHYGPGCSRTDEWTHTPECRIRELDAELTTLREQRDALLTAAKKTTLQVETYWNAKKSRMTPGDAALFVESSRVLRRAIAACTTEAKP